MHEFSIKYVGINNFVITSGFINAIHTDVLAVFGTRTQSMAQSNLGLKSQRGVGSWRIFAISLPPPCRINVVHLSATKRNTHVITAEFANLWVALGLRALARDGVANDLVNILTLDGGRCFWHTYGKSVLYSF
jgi:hypothetical protein